MAQREKDNSLIERILSAGCRVTVLRGPARSGKTVAALEMYRRYLDDFGRSRCMLIVPNAASLVAVKHQLLAASASGVLISPQVLTFASLAQRVLAAAGHPGRMLGDFRRHLLLRRIVDQLAGAGKLAALGAVADTPGLILSLDRSISELKRAAVEPDLLARAIGRGDAKSRDLLAVYRSYQRAMQDQGVYDVEGQMWQARDVLSQAAQAGEDLPGLSSVAAVAADGFIDFTPTQLEIIALLSQRLERVLITLPYEADGRERMWRWTGRTLERIGRALGDEVVEISAAPLPAPMRTVWDSLFDVDAPAGQWPEDIRIIAAAGAEAEVAAVARRIKRLLVEGAEPGSIAVLARSLETYRPIVERIFAACDIPVAPSGQPLAGVGAVRFLLDVAAMAPDFEYRNVLRVIANSYFRPEALGPYGPDQVAAAQMLIRQGNVLEGRAAYAAAARRLSRRAGAGQEDPDDDGLTLGTLDVSAQVLQSAAEMLETLFDLAGGATSAKGIASLIDALQLRQAACQTGRAELIARDLRALDQLGGVLGGLTEPHLTPAQLLAGLAATNCPPARGESVVDLLDVLDARSLRYEHVFLLGVSQGQFPRKFVESSLIRESDRIAWSAGGLELDSRGDLTAREMLLFYLAVSRAEKTLTISYLESGPSGEPAAASVFLAAALQPAGGLDQADDKGLIEHIDLGAATATDQLASRQEAFNTAIWQLVKGSSPAPSPALNWAVRHEPELIARCASGLLASYRRFRPGPVDRFDGRITDAGLLAGLAETYPHQTVLSAGRLNSYGQCPWQFFASQVLKLRPLTEPTRRLEPVTRGLFVHDALFRTMTDLRGRAAGPLRLAEVDQAELLAAVDRGVKAASAAVEATRPPYPALWQIQKDQIASQLRDYLLAQARSGQGNEQLHFELGFGLADAPADTLDPASSPDPISLATSAGQVRIRGKIDRIDRLTGQPAGLFVVDYKTGQLPTKGDIDQGRSLQLPIYTAAAEQMLAGPAVGGAFHRIGQDKQMHFSQLKAPRGDDRSFEQRRTDAAETIGRFVQGMASGRFDALPTHDCPSYCPFRQICGFSPARAELKAPSTEAQGPQP